MWDVIRNAVTQVKDALGVDIPELPVDLGSLDAAGLGEAVTTAAEGVTATATGAVDDLTATAGDAVTASGTQVTDTVSGITDAAR